MTRSIDSDAWDSRFASFRDVIHEQTAVFNRVHWSEEALQYLCVERDHHPIGGAVVRRVQAPLGIAQIFIIRWGPLWRPANERDDPANLRDIYRVLINELTIRQKGYLLVIPKADPDHDGLEEQTLRKLGFEALFQPGSPERYFVNVDQPPEDVLASFNQKWRYNLRKSQKQDLTLDMLDGEEGYRRFMALYRQMQVRKQFFETSPIDTLQDLVAGAPGELKPVFAIVRHGEEAVAGAAIDTSGERAIYLYGATNDLGNRLRAGYFMQWEIAQRLCGIDRIRWYDLGGGTSPDCSLHQFKRGMVGKAGTVSLVPPYFGIGANALQSFFGKGSVKGQLASFKLRETAHELLSKLR